jgi:uncharacterized membrane protein HdeD (DUF308 family)
MSHVSVSSPSAPSSVDWLRKYYFARAAFSVAWIVLALTIGRSDPAIAAALLIAYPAWDALANYLDARNDGGVASNPSQAINIVVSVVTTVAVAYATGMGMNAVLLVFGIWAALSGISQLVTAVRRWKTVGAQWVMILSGAQSALAGGAFIFMSLSTAVPDISTIAGYAGIGAFYFLVSAVWLTIKASRNRPAAI